MTASSGNSLVYLPLGSLSIVNTSLCYSSIFGAHFFHLASNCHDNAPMKSFWGSLKNELVHHRRYRTHEEAIREITEYSEVGFYNLQRRQARLGYLSPAAYERLFYQGQLAA